MKKLILATMVALVSMSANAESKSNNLIKGGVCPDTIPVAIHPVPMAVEKTNEEAEKLNEKIIIVLKEMMGADKGVVFDILNDRLMALKTERENLIKK